MAEIDPTVPAWAKQPEKPSYTAEEVGAVSKNELQAAVSGALAEAKASGAFDGEKGDKGDSYVLTEADKADIAAAVVESLGGQPVFGYVDENNVIRLGGDLGDGTYSIKYEMANGDMVNIGDMVLDSNVYYSVTNTLTNCMNGNDAKSVVAGGDYIGTINTFAGYEMKSISVTMGGVDITSTAVSGTLIEIQGVTGDIVIVAVAEEVKVAEPVTVDIELTDNLRIGSDGTDRTQAGYCATPHIDLTNIPKPCTIRLTKAFWCDASQSSAMVRVYAKKADNTQLVSGITNPTVGSGYFTVVDNSGGTGNDVVVTVTSDAVGFIRFSGYWAKIGVSDSSDAFASAGTKATLTYTPN